MGKGHGGLPDRWLDYIAIGKQITGIPIAACKVPLKEELVRNRISNDDERFTPDVLMRKVPNLGCVVDLTATYRYYDPSVFTRRGIRHEKIFCEGHVVPSPPTVRRFFQVVDEFLHSVQSRGKVLMVHCTHGLNRTGYLVSRYMVERRGYKPQDAIAAFNEARGHAIERDNYLEDLKKRNLLEGSEPQPAEDWWSQGAILAAIDVDQQQPARAISRKETDEDRASNQPEFAGESRERPRHHRYHGREQGRDPEPARAINRRDPDEDRAASKYPMSGASNQPDYAGESRERPRHNRNNYPPQRQWRNRGDPETRNYERDQQRSYDRDERPSSKNYDRDERPSSRNYERQFQPRQSFNYERDNRAAPRNSWRNQSYNPTFNGQQQYNRSNQPPHHLRFNDDASQVVRQGDERRDRSYRSETDERPSQNSQRRRRH